MREEHQEDQELARIQKSLRAEVFDGPAEAIRAVQKGVHFGVRAWPRSTDPAIPQPRPTAAKL